MLRLTGNMRHERVDIGERDGAATRVKGRGGHLGRGWWRLVWGTWLKHPVATVLLGAGIWWCLSSIPSTNSSDPPGAPTAVTSWGSRFTPTMWTYLVRRSDGSIVAVEPGKETARDRIIGSAEFAYRLRPEREMWSVQINADLRAGEESAARKAFADWLSVHPQRYWRGVASRISLKDDVNVMGYKGVRIGLSAAAMVMCGLLARSLAWAVPIFGAALEPLRRASLDPEERERRRRRRALAAGKCPGCGYEIRGLPKRRCPECNETWGAWETE